MSLRPLPLVAAAFALGILAADLAWSVPLVPAVLAVGAAAVLAGARGRLVGCRPLARAAGAVLLAAAAGHFALASRLPPAGAALPDGEVECSGMLSSVRALVGGRQELRVRRAACRRDGRLVVLGILSYADSAVVEAGAVVSLRGHLRRPGGFRNPGDPDRRRVEERRGYVAVLAPSRGTGLVVLRGPPPPSRRVARIRASLRAAVSARFPDPAVRPLMLALLTGDSSGIAETVRADFRRAGLAHVLAVSGLHVGLLAGAVLVVVTSLLARLRVPLAPRAALTAALVVALLGTLVLVIGPRPSVARAALMGSILVLRRLLQRPGQGLRDALALAMALQLAADPSALFDPGFQLSHAAVFGLACVRREGGALRSGLRASTAATVATAPLVAWHFGPVPLGGLVTNVAGLPLTAVVVTGGMLGLALALAPVTAAAGAAARALLFVAEAGADVLGWARIVLPASRVAPVLLATALSCTLARSARGRRVAASAALVVATLLPRPGAGLLRVVFLDVGQGDAAILHLPDGGTAFIDTGTPAGSAPSRYLARLGLDRVEHVVITHDHADHSGGLGRTGETVSFGRIIGPGPIGGRPVHEVSAADTLDFGPSLRVYVLAPFGRGEGNEASLALAVAFGRTRLLLMGDAEDAAEHRIVEAWPDLIRSDAVKVGHHGSRTSSTPLLVRRAAARGTLAVVSVGARNRYGHPAPDVIRRWKDAGAVVRMTSDRGAICIESDGRDVREGCP
jgi:competence protein ComEC